MKAKRPTRRNARATPFLAILFFVCAGHQVPVFAAPSDSLAAVGIAGFDRFERLIASDLMVVGPVEAIDYGSASLQVLGQLVRLPVSEQRSLLRVAVGNVVAVHGRILAAGEIEGSKIAVTAQLYVAGSQALFVRGVVSNLQTDVGVLAVGKLNVDYTAALYSLDASSLSEGAEFVFSGIQPSPDGSALALSAAVRPNGIAGSDLQGKGITGSDLQGKGITGSDLQGKGITGSDLQGKGITGSDLQGKGITGSDLQGKGITGSDLQGKGITGSDLQGKGITGSDLQSKGITGSDLQGKGITGSDLQGKGITGSDLQGKGITGSDLQGKGITGSDLQGKGITGSDLQGKGITGSDLAGITGSDF